MLMNTVPGYEGKKFKRKLILNFVILGNARSNQEGIVSNSVVYFTNHVPVNTLVGGPAPLKLKKILDMVITFLLQITQVTRITFWI